MREVTVVATALFLSLSLTLVPTSARQNGDELARRQALERFRSGQTLLLAERFEQAASEFSTAISLDPLLAIAHYGLGQAYMGLKRYASAIQAFNGAKDAYGTISQMRQSDALAAERRLDDETRELRDSLARVRSGQIKNSGPALEQQLEKRLEDLETMRPGRGGNRYHPPAEVSLALGSAYYRNNQPQDAEREWQAAIVANPKLGEAHNNLAVIYMLTGRKKEAQDSIKAAEKANFRVNPQLKADINKMP